MKKILVPLDGSAMAEQALDIVEEMLDRNIRLVLVRVLNPLTLTGADFTKQEAKDYLCDQAESFQSRHPDIEVACFIEEGLAANKIIDLSRTEDVGLIVMTTHGAGGLGRWLMGSVAEKVVRHAPCPVLTLGAETLKKRTGYSED